MSTAWAETQSMFMDTMFSSIEWRTRYAKDKTGNEYPFELFKRKVRKLAPLRPTHLHHIIFVSTFEKEIYETKNLNLEKVMKIARKNYRKYFDMSVDSLSALNVPHIYSWESSASYHGYGLAQLAVYQWREYFYKKFGYIVDNPHVGEEMKKVWSLGARKTFKEFVVLATGKKLSASSFLKDSVLSAESIIKIGKNRIRRMEKVRPFASAINLNASIQMVHGEKVIATNRKSFEDMANKYKDWLLSQELELKK